MHNYANIPVFEYNQITYSIYIGTNQCCRVHFNELLTQEGIRADISLESEQVDAPFGVSFYTWIPIVNHSAPTHEQLTFAVATLTELERLHVKTYVHCKNGHGRAPTIVAAYLIAKQGVSVDEAIALIKAKRSTIHLEELQIDALRAFAESLG